MGLSESLRGGGGGWAAMAAASHAPKPDLQYQDQVWSEAPWAAHRSL